MGILSDLHLEFRWDEQRGVGSTHRFIDSLNPEGVDVLILAGDICMYKQAVDAMSLICRRFKDSDVIWVCGNHEFYSSDRATVAARVREALAQNRNLHHLDCEAKVIRGQRFVGATMWFPWNDINPQIEFFMNDFRVIKDLRKWVYEENLRATNMFMGSVNEDDVVITHHLPSRRSIAPQYSQSDLNNFFLCDMEKFIVDRGPKLWVHGHTHESFDYEIPHTGNSGRTTRVVCNPRGYFPHDLNPNFDKEKVIEI